MVYFGELDGTVYLGHPIGIVYGGTSGAVYGRGTLLVILLVFIGGTLLVLLKEGQLADIVYGGHLDDIVGHHAGVVYGGTPGIVYGGYTLLAILRGLSTSVYRGTTFKYGGDTLLMLFIEGHSSGIVYGGHLDGGVYGRALGWHSLWGTSGVFYGRGALLAILLVFMGALLVNIGGTMLVLLMEGQLAGIVYVGGTWMTLFMWGTLQVLFMGALSW